MRESRLLFCRECEKEMTDKEFLSWLADRIVYVYKESPNTDFVLRLWKIADSLSEEKVEPALSEPAVEPCARKGGYGLCYCSECTSIYYPK